MVKATDPGYVAIHQVKPNECGNNEQISTFLQEGGDYFVKDTAWEMRKLRPLLFYSAALFSLPWLKV